MIKRTAVITFIMAIALVLNAFGDCTWVPTSTTLTTTCGTVGVGTSNPQRKFHVVGPNDVVPAFPSAALGTNDAAVIENNGNANLAFVSSDTGMNVIRFVRSGASGMSGAILYAHSLNVMTLWTNGAERMRILSNGNVGINNPAPGATLDVTGTIHATGSISADGALYAKYQDVAEWVPAVGELAPGSVVIVAPDHQNSVVASTEPYDTRVAGVVSPQPGLLLGEAGPSKAQIATTGRVRVKVDATAGPIHAGDILVTSTKPGMAMRSETVDIGGVRMHRPGTVVGKALEPLDSGTGEILVLLTLQ